MDQSGRGCLPSSQPATEICRQLSEHPYSHPYSHPYNLAMRGLEVHSRLAELLGVTDLTGKSDSYTPTPRSIGAPMSSKRSSSHGTSLVSA